MEPECMFCGESDCELRVYSDGNNWGKPYATDYICEECFSHDVMSFDDLPAVPNA